MLIWIPGLLPGQYVDVPDVSLKTVRYVSQQTQYTRAQKKHWRRLMARARKHEGPIIKKVTLPPLNATIV